MRRGHISRIVRRANLDIHRANLQRALHFKPVDQHAMDRVNAAAASTVYQGQRLGL